MRPGDEVAVRARGQGWRRRASGGRDRPELDPGLLAARPAEESEEIVTAGVRAQVPSRLAGNGPWRMPSVGPA